MQRSSWERHDLIAAPAVLRAISYHKKTTEHNGSFLSSKSPDHDYQTRPGLKRTGPGLNWARPCLTEAYLSHPGAIGHSGVETRLIITHPLFHKHWGAHVVVIICVFLVPGVIKSHKNRTESNLFFFLGVYAYGCACCLCRCSEMR